MPDNSPTLADILLKMLAKNPSLGNAKARELLGIDEAAYESLKAEMLAEGKIVQGRGRGGSIKLAEAEEPKGHPSTSLRMTKPNAPKPKAEKPEPKSQEPDPTQTEQAFLNELDKKLWTAADKLRSNLDAAVYKHAVLGLVFLKYVSDSFEIRQQEVEQMLRDPKSDYFIDPAEYGEGGKGGNGGNGGNGGEGSEGSKGSKGGASAYDAAIRADLEIRDYYTQKNVFWVPPLARWNTIKDNAKLPSGTVINVASANGPTYTITSLGKLIDDALEAVERENPKLKGVLNKTYTQLQLDPANLSSLIDLIATIPFVHGSMHAKDILGHVYEYFLGQFALAEGKKGGQYYTPKSIVGLVVRMLQPLKGRIYDPAMGSGGFFVQSEEFIEAFGGRLGDISVYGQESNPTTWRLAAMNMAIRGIDFNFGKEPANSFTNDQHPDLRADYVMANPPFNVKEWWDKRLENDPRWQYGTPPTGNANFAWLQHMLYHLQPKGSMALLLVNGSMSSNSGGEGDIRKRLVEADLVECMVALPGQLFTNTQIPACIWFLTKNKKARTLPANAEGETFTMRDRRGEVLFIDARKLGFMKDRVLRDFAAEDVERITKAFHSWQIDLEYGEVDQGNGITALVDPDPSWLYMDQPGFCRSATLEEIAKHDFVLTPGRYVGAGDLAEDEMSFDDRMKKLTQELAVHLSESKKLDERITKNLATIGYEV